MYTQQQQPHVGLTLDQFEDLDLTRCEQDLAKALEADLVTQRQTACPPDAFSCQPSAPAIRIPVVPARTSTTDVYSLLHKITSLSVGDSSFTPKPFTGAKLDGDSVERWLDYFNQYVAFRQLPEDMKLSALQNAAR